MYKSQPKLFTSCSKHANAANGNPWKFVLLGNSYGPMFVLIAKYGQFMSCSSMFIHGKIHGKIHFRWEKYGKIMIKI